MAAAEPKRAKKDNFSVTFDFSTLRSLESSGLQWRNEPSNYDLVEGEGLKVTPNPKTDYWLKPYREPPANRASGHCLMHPVTNGMLKWCATVSFSLSPSIQFDQAGVMVYSDDSNWMKAGIEIENGEPNMSCVVTDGMSDWNYMEWPTSKNIQIRVNGTMYKTVCDCKVEYYDEKREQWCFLREGPIGLSENGISVGIMCCSPLKESDAGMEAVFKSFSLSEQDV